MSLVPKSLRKMRIIAIPLTRPKLSARAEADPRRILTYYQFQMPSPVTNKPAAAGQKPVYSRWLPEEGVIKFLQLKAANTWAGFGKAKEGSWQLKVHQMGERLVDRMEFEELALKGVDTSLGPSLSQPSDLDKQLRIPLIYPSSLSSDSESLRHLKTLLQHRMPLHRRGFYLWMIIAPLTTPFMIVPVIPNLPFFFCVWRSWSHYKAYRATQYLGELLANGVIIPEGSEALDGVIKKNSAPEETRDKNGQNHKLLLTREAVPAIVSLLELKSSTDADLYRAIEQARLRIMAQQLGSS